MLGEYVTTGVWRVLRVPKNPKGEMPNGDLHTDS